MTDTRSLFSVGDRVKIVSATHPWAGNHGSILEPFDGAGLDWIVQLDNGQRSGVSAQQLRREFPRV